MDKEKRAKVEEAKSKYLFVNGNWEKHAMWHITEWMEARSPKYFNKEYIEYYLLYVELGMEYLTANPSLEAYVLLLQRISTDLAATLEAIKISANKYHRHIHHLDNSELPTDPFMINLLSNIAAATLSKSNVFIDTARLALAKIIRIPIPLQTFSS